MLPGLRPRFWKVVGSFEMEHWDDETLPQLCDGSVGPLREGRGLLALVSFGGNLTRAPQSTEIWPIKYSTASLGAQYGGQGGIRRGGRLNVPSLQSNGD